MFINFISINWKYNTVLNFVGTYIQKKTMHQNSIRMWFLKSSFFYFSRKLSSRPSSPANDVDAMRGPKENDMTLSNHHLDYHAQVRIKMLYLTYLKNDPLEKGKLKREIFNKFT